MERRDKILYVSYVRQGGGDWVHTRQFLGAFKKLHENVAVHLPRITESRSEALKSAGNRTDPFRELRYLAGMFLTRLREQWRLLKKVKPDLVIFRACRYTSLILLCRILNIPIVLEVNAPMLERRFLDRHEQFRLLSFWCRLEAMVFGLADHLVVVTDVLKTYYTGLKIKPSFITTVPNGVDITLFHPHVDGRPVRRMLGIDHRVVIGFSGSFIPWHGFDFLTDALDGLIRTRPDLKEKIALLLVGDARGKVRKFTCGEAPAVMTGQVPYREMPAYLAAMDIIAAPYPRIEPFYFSPLKIVEAMAMGRPVIASAQGQIRLLIHENVTGVLYKPGDREEFNSKLINLIENPQDRRIMGNKAHDRIAAGFTWHHNAERILKICRHLIEKRRTKE